MRTRKISAIYFDPLTEKIFEGKAWLIKKVFSVDRDTQDLDDLEYWVVEFIDFPGYHFLRWVKP